MWAKLNQSIFRDGDDDDDERGDALLDDESANLCSLSPTQRIYAFAACLIAGLALMFLLEVFLIGAGKQMRMMFDSIRIYATAIYLGCVVLALICALLIHSKILTIIAVIVEICALVWYSLSYIPFARRMVSELMIRLCDTEL